MKIQILSDLHLEFFGKENEVVKKNFLKSTIEDNIDVLVIAGDYSISEYLEKDMALLCQRNIDIVYTPGNHEYYHSSFEKVDYQLEKLSKKYPNLHILNPGTIELNGVKFVSCTLWFQESCTTDIYSWCLNDFKYIEGFRNFVFGINKKHLEFLSNEVTSDSVVITHHLPSFKCSSFKYKNEPTQCFYVCEKAEPILLEKKPSFWIYGHTHDSNDLTIGNTRLICNPYGYHNYEPNYSFNPNLIIEI